MDKLYKLKCKVSNNLDETSIILNDIEEAIPVINFIESTFNALGIDEYNISLELLSERGNLDEEFSKEGKRYCKA